MNKYQRLVIIVATIDALLMLLFPPFSSQPLARGMLPGFDGYYALFPRFGTAPIHSELLVLQLIFVAINALSAWLVLQTKKHHDIPEFAFSKGIACFVAANLVLVFAFPPFEPYQSLLRTTGSTFDSFYYVFGDRSQRPIFAPLLHLECVFIAINALALLLLFNAVKRSDDATRRRIMKLSEDLPDEALLEISTELQHRVEEHHARIPRATEDMASSRHSP